jgi:hypothetical protein
MNWRSDDVVRTLLHDSVREYKSVQSLAQVMVSVMQVRQEPIETFLDGAERDPAVMRALQMARSAFENLEVQQTIVFPRRAAPKIPIRSVRGRHAD